ncbi:MAG: 4Fe-4S dicluster domain-containing protein [Deltaproteobacteria bacterium]|nr:4Fe-4S dicluster domain-containing protein [Deltaproteobacteria bacterium]
MTWRNSWQDAKAERGVILELRAIHERCSGCRACELACALANFREMNPAKSALDIEGRFPAPGDYRIRLCDQCGECTEACPEDAIYLEDGIYSIDPDDCTGCGVCVEACPHSVMHEHPSLDSPFKCTLCGACVEICPRGALVMEGGA